MTVILTTSDFWIERHVLTVPLLAAASINDSAATNVDKAGRIRSWSISFMDHAADLPFEAIGAAELKQSDGSDIIIDQELNQFLVRIGKISDASGGGSVVAVVTLYISK